MLFSSVWHREWFDLSFTSRPLNALHRTEFGREFGGRAIRHGRRLSCFETSLFRCDSATQWLTELTHLEGLGVTTPPAAPKRYRKSAKSSKNVGTAPKSSLPGIAPFNPCSSLAWMRCGAW